MEIIFDNQSLIYIAEHQINLQQLLQKMMDVIVENVSDFVPELAIVILLLYTVPLL